MYYGFVYYLLMIILAYGIFPISIPLINRKQMEVKDRHFNYYLLALLVVTAAVVSFTITVGENWAETTPRIHLRYICCMFLPIVIMMLNAIEHSSSISKKQIILSTVCLSASFIYLGFMGENILVPKLQIFDETMLQYLAQNQDWQMFILGSICILLIIISALYVKKFKTGVILTLVMLLGLNAVNTVENVYIWKISTFGNNISKETSDMAIEISDFVKENVDKHILFLLNRQDHALLLTYANEDNCYFVDTDVMNTYLSEHEDEEISWKNMKSSLKAIRLSAWYEDVESVDIIVVSEDLEITVDDTAGKELRQGWKGLKMYQINNPNMVPKLNNTKGTVYGLGDIDQQLDDALKKHQEKQEQQSSSAE